MRTVIADAIIVEGDEMDVINRGYIVTEGDRILRVGSGDCPIKEADIHVDASGMIIVPGFVNAHTHVMDAVIKDSGIGKRLEDFILLPTIICNNLLASTPEDKLVSSMKEAFLEMLEAGVLVACDFGCGGNNAILRAKGDIPIRLVLMANLCLWAYEQYSDSELTENKKVLSEAAEREVTELLNTTDGLAVNTANDFTDPALEQLHRLTSNLGKMSCIHAAESPWYSEESLKRTGLTDVERILRYFKPSFMFHMVQATERDLELTAQNGLSVVCCPRSNAVLGLGFPPIRKMISKGILTGLGTDNVSINSPSMFSEMEFISKAFRGLGQDPTFPASKDILKTATINGAKILHLDNELGSIKEGKKAYLVFIDGTDKNLRPVVAPVATIVNRARSDNVKALMVEGKFITKEKWDREAKSKSHAACITELDEN